MDHAVPAPTIKDAAGGPHARKFAADFGIERFYDVGRHGICHQVIAENGLARPGEILACTDSHTCAAGAYNTAARGLGPAEVYSIMCTGTTWFQVAPTIRYELDGVKPDTVSGKDIFLHIANEYGDATNLNLEFGGPGLAGIPMHDRRTIATQGAEVSADFSHVRGRRRVDAVSSTSAASPDTTPPQPDPDATYHEVRRIDLATLEPYVARPGTRQPQRAARVTARQPEGGPGVHRVVRERPTRGSADRRGSVARQDRCPGRAAAGHTGLAGGVPRSHAAGLSSGHRRRGRRHHQLDVRRLLRLPHGRGRTRARCASPRAPATSPGAWAAPRREIFMASPATVAASAITGYITDPRSVTA